MTDNFVNPKTVLGSAKSQTWIYFKLRVTNRTTNLTNYLKSCHNGLGVVNSLICQSSCGYFSIWLLYICILLYNKDKEKVIIGGLLDTATWYSVLTRQQILKRFPSQLQMEIGAKYQQLTCQNCPQSVSCPQSRFPLRTHSDPWRRSHWTDPTFPYWHQHVSHYSCILYCRYFF